MSRPCIVVDCCENWEQPLGLITPADDDVPPAGLLDWPSRIGPRSRVHVFQSAKAARAAIAATEHYVLAYEEHDLRPRRKNCRVVFVNIAKETT